MDVNNKKSMNSSSDVGNLLLLSFKAAQKLDFQFLRFLDKNINYSGSDWGWVSSGQTKHPVSVISFLSSSHLRLAGKTWIHMWALQNKVTDHLV